jgi:D-arabinose 1-dehydrogenase-like Zn-dependent alcohol dehydrogenase
VKGIVLDGPGAPWREAEIAEPAPGPGQLLVEMLASGVCYTDHRQATDPAYGTTFPRVPGHEPIGRVVATGTGVEGLRVGDIVGVAYAQAWCGTCQYCQLGRYEHCGKALHTGVTVDGGHAEMALFHAASAVQIPAAIDPVEAAPLMCAGFTAYSGLCDLALRPGERCAVVGVGGLGHLGLQYAAALGTEVVAVTHTAVKADSLRELGAHEVVVLDSPDGVGERLAAIGGVDAILYAGNAIGSDVLRGLRPYGRLSLVGVTAEEIKVAPREMVFGKYVISGSSQGPRDRLHEMLQLHARTGARTHVETYGLDRAHDAYNRVTRGSPRYRVVLTPRS